jgi:cytochrome b559 alpha subunit
MSGSTGERSFADIITCIRYWVIHSKPIPSLFTRRIKGVGYSSARVLASSSGIGLGALGQTSILQRADKEFHK